MGKVQYKVNPKEGLYYGLRVVISLFVYFIIGFYIWQQFTYTQSSILLTQLIISIFVLIFLSIVIKGSMVGLIKANSVKINKDQFSDIYKVAEVYSEKLGLNRVPDIYLLQSGGVLNAFATKLFFRNYIVLYSEILEEYFENNKETVEFIIAHELGHVKRRHIRKELLVLPSIIIPLLNQAYYRACEYTCDSIGKALNPKGAINGILTLAGGKKLYRKINSYEFINQRVNDRSFWRWIVEKCSTHPNLYKRLDKVYSEKFDERSKVVEKEFIASDHSKYMPS